MLKNSIWIIIDRESSNSKNKEVPLLKVHEVTSVKDGKVKRSFTIFISRANNEHRYSVKKAEGEIFITGSIDDDTRGYVMLQRVANKRWKYCEGICISMKEGQTEKATAYIGEIIFDSSNVLDRILEEPKSLYSVQ